VVEGRREWQTGEGNERKVRLEPWRLTPGPMNVGVEGAQSETIEAPLDVCLLARTLGPKSGLTSRESEPMIAVIGRV
jgi:hypothetical protein